MTTSNMLENLKKGRKTENMEWAISIGIALTTLLVVIIMAITKILFFILLVIVAIVFIIALATIIKCVVFGR
jgi:hypothetical protein